MYSVVTGLIVNGRELLFKDHTSEIAMNFFLSYGNKAY